jgi:hypothetical protein
MRPELATQRAARVQQGFNLIEAAIVLGVVGLVIGGIWVAAAQVQENLRISKFSGQLVSIQSSVRQLFYRKGPIPSGEVSSLIAAGIFPADMVSNSQVYSPWGGQLMNLLGASSDDYEMYWSFNDVNDCIAMWMALRKIGATTFVDSTDFGGDNFGGELQPTASVTDVEDTCEAAAPYVTRNFQIFLRSN